VPMKYFVGGRIVYLEYVLFLLTCLYHIAVDTFFMKAINCVEKQ